MASVYRALVEEKGHIYVCGDITMAVDVMTRICDIIAKCRHISKDDADIVLKGIKVGSPNIFVGFKTHWCGGIWI